MSNRSPTIAFRLDEDDYVKFSDYVEESELNQSQVVEKAVKEFLERRTFFMGKLRISLGIAIIAVTTAFYASAGNYPMTAVAVALFITLPWTASFFSKIVK